MTDRTWGTYFSNVSVLLLVLSIVAFSDNLFTDVGQPSNRDPKFVVHGIFGLAWYVLLATQANLVRARNLRLHRKLGIATFIVAIRVTLSTLYLFVVLWKGWPDIGARATYHVNARSGGKGVFINEPIGISPNAGCCASRSERK